MRCDMPTYLAIMSDLTQRMDEQQQRMTSTPFTYDRNGLRLAIAAIEDENQELYDWWAGYKRSLGTPGVIHQIRHELLDIAAVAMLTYEKTFEYEPRENEAAPQENVLMQPPASTTETEA
jgi:hypothetical protein